MKNIMISRILYIFIWILLFAGCSQSDQSPVSLSQDDSINTDLPVAGTAVKSAGSINGEAVWGLYEGVLNLETLDASLIPLRSLSSGTKDSVEVDITSFLLGTPCNNCVEIKSISLDVDSNPVVKIGIRHPFLPGVPANPPSAANRLDLHVFNVRGFIISDGFDSPETFTAAGKTVGGFELLNADGLSGEFDQYWDAYLSTTANLHPYVLHYDDYSQGNFDSTNANGFTDLLLPTGNLVMPMGSAMDYKDYVFHLNGTGNFNFLYALTVSYGISAIGRSQKLIPTYRIPQFNSKAASEVRITNIDDSDLLSSITESTCAITVEVKDINHGVSIGEEINQMDADSSVSRIAIEIPGVTNPIWDTSTPDFFLQSGDGRETPLVYNITVTNATGAASGIYNGLLGVYDSYTGTGSLTGNAIYGLPPGGDPSGAFFTVSEWVTYTTFSVEVHQSCGPITGSVTTPATPTVTIMDDETLNFVGTGTSANGGNPITEYRWRWNDGTPDSLGSTQSHVFSNFNCGGSEMPVTYNVTLTLKDSCTPPNVQLVGSIGVTVECPDCVNLFEDFDGGTQGDWDASDWSVQNVDNGLLYYGGFDEYMFHSDGENCSVSMCKSGNCFFTSGDDFAHGGIGGFCNDYSGSGHYYLISPTLNFRNVEVTNISMSVWHFFSVTEGTDPDGCALYASIDNGLTFPTQLSVISGVGYNSTFTSGIRTGDPCFTGLISTGTSSETVFDLTPLKGKSQVVLRFEQQNIKSGPTVNYGSPVGWWIDNVTIDICP
jgi:hypothetical protein